MRIYDYKLNIQQEDEEYELFSVDDWMFNIKNISIFNDHGCGYWVKDGYESKDEVFSTEPEDATHVVWYNK